MEKRERQTSFRRRTRSRAAYIERLENRRLLVAEGSAFDLSQTFDTTGLVGSLSSTIRWGDGSETSGSVSGSVDSDGPLRISFRYEGSFFNGANASRRVLLQNAADMIVERFSDDLAAITPTSLLQWDAVTSNPTTGEQLTIPNLRVAENELIVFVGGRELSSGRVGEAGPGSFSFEPFRGTQEEVAQVQEFRETVMERGEAGAAGPDRTDVGPWGGSIAFDTATNFHFGTTTEGLDSDEVDFLSVASHELLHLLGLGTTFVGRENTSWETASTGTVFTGPKATALFGGNIPLGDIDHFREDVEFNGQQALITPLVLRGDRIALTPLDLAALDDIGWTIRPSEPAIVTASHVYADNPLEGTTFPVEVTLTGSRVGSITQTLTSTVTNVVPTLTVASNQAVQIGQAISITDIGSISDPGFRNQLSDPPTAETFEYTIDWGDGSDVDAGAATIDRDGNAAGLLTLASFNGTHTYSSTGNFTVRVGVTDDDGGLTTENFSITVNPTPVLSIAVSSNTVAENAASGVVTLTVTRSGPTTATDQIVNLLSSDPSEATVPATAVILSGETSVVVPVNIVDDTLLDGSQSVTFTASAAAVDPGADDLLVSDVETISVRVNVDSVREDEPAVARLIVTRSNTDRDEPLVVSISGGDDSQLQAPATITIAAGAASASAGLIPIDDRDAELPINLTYVATASGYLDSAGNSDSVMLLDDEPPLFQNQSNQFDVDNNGQVTSLDALLTINLLAGPSQLDPAVDTFEDIFPDVSGDYQITAIDALQIINELGRVNAAVAAAGEESVSSGLLSNSSARLNDNALLSALFDLDDENDELEDNRFDAPRLS